MKKVLRWREENPIESLEVKPPGPALDHFRGSPFERIIDEWPETPWVEIPQENRAWYLEVHNTVAQWSWEGYEEWRLKQRPALATFTVTDWGKSNTALGKEFLKWLKHHRPNGEQIREMRGRLGLREQVKSWLKGLGAWRLWCRARLSHSQILNHCIQCDRVLYNNQPELSNAIRLAAAHLERADQPYRE